MTLPLNQIACAPLPFIWVSVMVPSFLKVSILIVPEPSPPIKIRPSMVPPLLFSKVLTVILLPLLFSISILLLMVPSLMSVRVGVLPLFGFKTIAELLFTVVLLFIKVPPLLMVTFTFDVPELERLTVLVQRVLIVILPLVESVDLA
ncbi:Uncharacterised protein [Campylobacter jejuni]|nr:Uncharacterised protein [Campylobacter jejuni]